MSSVFCLHVLSIILMVLFHLQLRLRGGCGDRSVPHLGVQLHGEVSREKQCHYLKTIVFD